MRLWGKTIKDGQKMCDDIVEIPIKKRGEIYGNTDLFVECLGQLCKKLDLERPMMVSRHLKDLCEFSRVVFLPSDFMEEVDFDRFTVELIV